MSTARVSKRVSKKKNCSHLIVLTIGLALCAFSVALAFSTLPSQVSAFNFHQHENEHNNQTLAQLCSNGIDDDEDGYIDLLDSDCAEYIPVCSPTEHADETLHCVPNEPEDPVCVAPQQLVNHVCTDPEPPQDPECIAPEVLVNHECEAPVIVICPEGQHHPEGDEVTCVANPPPTCPDNQHFNSENVCVDNEVTPPADTNTSSSNSNNPECSDGIDNDNDGRVDYPSDNSCFDGSDTTEGNDGGAFFGGNGGYSGNPVIGAGLVLGASTDLPPGCTALLTAGSYMRIGSKNDPAKVMKLQEFLNSDLGLTLDVDGIFGQTTFNAVAAFQKKYSDDVLLPWVKYGLKNKDSATGYVYKTTLRKINLLNCATLNIPMPQLP